MATDILVNLNMNGNQLLGLRLEVLAADPSGGGLYEGRIWFNSTDDLVKYYSGTAIIPWGTGGGGGVATLTVDNLTIENTGTATNPSIRVKAGGIGNTHVTGPIDYAKLGLPITDVNVNTHKIINLVDPTANQDAATKAYVDAFVNGLAYKDAVRAATTGAGTLASAFENGDVIDGVTLVTGDRILVKNQASGAENGIYVVAATGAPARALDADSSGDLVGSAVFVSEGTTQGNTLWVVTTDAPIVVGTTALVWAQFGGPGAYQAGAGLTLTGVIFSLTSPVSVAMGGTGATDAAGARTNLGALTKFAVTIGTGALTSIPVTHNLNTRDVVVAVYDAATFEDVICDVFRTSVNVVTLGFTIAPATNALRAVVTG